MTDFTKQITGFRYIQTQFGDTLQAVAQRELGDAGQWSKLAWFNDLVPPYLVDDAADARAGVLVTGSTIRVPAASAQVDAAVSPDEVFLTDLQLLQGGLQFENGDLAVLSGRPNLRQALSNRITTNHGELVFHGTYGANLGRLIGALAGPVRAMIAQKYVQDALAQETRVKTTSKVTATTQGDRLEIVAEVVPITGAVLTTGVVV